MHINASELHPISFIIIITTVFRFEHFYGENYLFTTLQSVMSSCRQNSRKIIRDFFFHFTVAAVAAFNYNKQVNSL